MKALLPLALLAALAACGGRQKAPPVELNAPSQATTNEVAAPPIADPASSANAAAPAEAGDGAGPAEAERFIVCPGHPRCPKNEEGRPPAN